MLKNSFILFQVIVFSLLFYTAVSYGYNSEKRMTYVSNKLWKCYEPQVIKFSELRIKKADVILYCDCSQRMIRPTHPRKGNNYGSISAELLSAWKRYIRLYGGKFCYSGLMKHQGYYIWGPPICIENVLQNTPCQKRLEKEKKEFERLKSKSEGK